VKAYVEALRRMVVWGILVFAEKVGMCGRHLPLLDELNLRPNTPAARRSVSAGL